MSFFRKLFGGKKEELGPEPEVQAPSVPKRDLSQAGQPVDCSGVDWNGGAQRSLARELFPARVTDSLRGFLEAEEFHGNPYCTPADAAVLYAMAGHFQPGRVMEAGCGYTTRVLRMAKEDFSLPGEQIAVDPEPCIDIGEFVDAHLIMPVWEVPLDDFKLLQAGEMAFFDSSHVYTEGSDSKHIVDKILPALAPGVIVGFHGIRLPKNYARGELEQGWNEQEALLEWLKASKAEILFAGGWLAENEAEALPLAGPCTALWFRIRE